MMPVLVYYVKLCCMHFYYPLSSNFLYQYYSFHFQIQRLNYFSLFHFITTQSPSSNTHLLINPPPSILHFFTHNKSPSLPYPIMEKSTNPSSIKIQMNNFTLNLQTLLPKDHQQLPTTQRKTNKTERRTNSNFQHISPLKVKKKTKEKDYATTKNKSKKQDLFEITKPPSKPSKLIKQKKQPQTSKKPKKVQSRNIQSNIKNRKDKSTRLQRHFTDYDHVIESARLRTSPSQNYHNLNFNSESISKSASRSRSKSYKKIKNNQDLNNRNKSRSKSIFQTSNNERLNTQRSTSKIKTKQVQKRQKTQQIQQKSTQKIIKKHRSSKSRERKSIDNYIKKSKSRQRIYTQVTERHPLDEKHFNSDYVKQDDDKVFMSHKKSKSKFERLSDNLMSNSSEMGTMGPKFTSNKATSKEKLNEKSQKKKKSKKVSGTASTTNIQKQHQQTEKQKQKKLNASKKLSTKPSRKQTLKQKQTLQSQFNFYQSTNVQKKKPTQEDSCEFMQRTTAKKSKKMKTQAGQMWDSKFEVGELSGWKKGKREEGDLWAVEKAFKKKKKGVDIVDKLFSNEGNESGQYEKQRLSNSNQHHAYDQPNSGSVTQRVTSTKPQQPFPTSHPKPRQFPQVKKLTIMTDFNPLQNKQIYFDDISKILLRKKKSQQEERESMSRSQKSIRDEVMQSRNGSMSQEWNGEDGKGERSEDDEVDVSNEGQGQFGYVLHKNNYCARNQHSQRSSHVSSQHSPQRQSQIHRIRQQDLQQSSCQQDSENSPLSNEVQAPSSLQIRSQSSHQLDQLQQLNNHLQKLIHSPLRKELQSSRENQQSQQNQESQFMSSDVSIKEQPSFGQASPVNNFNSKPHPKSYTLIQTTVKKVKNNQNNAEMMTSINNQSDTLLQQPTKDNRYKRANKRDSQRANNGNSQKPQKKSISSGFIRQKQEYQRGGKQQYSSGRKEQYSSVRSSLCSPSSYAMQNKQKVISSLLQKPRKSVQEQFMIAKTLSNKRLLQELQLLDTLEKIQKSVQNSLVYEVSTRNYYGVTNKGEDNVLEQKVNTKNYQSNRGQKREEQLSPINNLVLFDNRQEEQSINQLEQELLSLKESSNITKFINQHLKRSVRQVEEQVRVRSPETMLLNTEDRVEQKEKEDSPLLSNHSNEFKWAHNKNNNTVNQFRTVEQQHQGINVKQQSISIKQQDIRIKPHPISQPNLPTTNKQSPVTQKQFKRSSPAISTHLTHQQKVNPFQQTYEQIQNFFSNNSYTSNQNQDDDQCEIKLFLNSGDGNIRINNRPQKSQWNDRSGDEILGEDVGVVGQEGNIGVKKKVEYSELTLEFEKEMDDYLKDHSQSSVKSKIQQIKANALKTINNHNKNNSLNNQNNNNNNKNKDHNNEYNNGNYYSNKLPQTLPKQQQQSLEQSDQFFYHKSTKPLESTTKHSLTQHSLINNQALKTQLSTFVENKLLQQFCEHLTKNKQILHSFLFFISKCNLVVIGEPQSNQAEVREQREINEEKFMEYLQAQIYSNNHYITNLGADIIAFVNKSQENQALFLKSINRPFGILPLKTLKWMRKVYAQQETKKEQDQDNEDQEENDDQQQNEGKEQSSESMSGLSDCSQVQAIFPPTLLADFDAYQSENIIQQMNQQQFYLNHAVYAALNQICDRFRPFGQNGYPVIAKHRPKHIQSLQQIQPKIMKRLTYILNQRWGRIQFSSQEQPEKIINETYKRMDEDLRRDDDERWCERNMDDTVFENVYYLSKHIVDMVVNQEVMEMFRLVGG